MDSKTQAREIINSAVATNAKKGDSGKWAGFIDHEDQRNGHDSHILETLYEYKSKREALSVVDQTVKVLKFAFPMINNTSCEQR